MDKYEPTPYILCNPRLDPMRGFGELIQSATDQGITVTVDWDTGEELIVNSQNARYAAHEADQAWFSFYKDGERLGLMHVIPDGYWNDGWEDDWLVDYTYTLEKVLTFPS